MSILRSSMRSARPSSISPISSPSKQSAEDTLQALYRQTTYLQGEIQYLLDAQSAGLLAGLGQETDSEDEAENASARTGPIHLPTSSSMSSSHVNSLNTISQIKRRRPSLSTSRRRIYTSLIQLSEVKASESEALNVQHTSLSDFLSELSILTEKKSKIESSIHAINAETEGSEDSFAHEEQTLVQEIAEMERKLEESNARLRHVRSQKQEGSSRRTSRLSSWQGALDEVEHTIKQSVLSGHGLEDTIPDMRRKGIKSGSIGVWSLPKERRTVELVREDVTDRAKKLETRHSAAENESLACSEGAEMWVLSINKIQAVEELLADEMNNLVSSKMDVANGSDDATGMIKVMNSMADTIVYLEHNLDTAERKGWNLLVCAIGAEVEALKQGRDLLQETLRMTQGESSLGTLSMMTAKSRLPSDLTDGDPSSSKMVNESSSHISPPLQANSGLKNVANNSQHHENPLEARAEIVEHDDEDDDAPGPDLLIEHNG